MRGREKSPWRTVVQHVVVVDSELLSSRERLEGADTGDVPEHRVGHLRQSAIIFSPVVVHRDPYLSPITKSQFIFASYPGGIYLYSSRLSLFTGRY